jgi:hypothetical protein
MQLTFTRTLLFASLCSTIALDALGQRAPQTAPSKLPSVVLDLRGQSSKVSSKAALPAPITRFANSTLTTGSTCNLVTNGDFDTQLSTPLGQINNVSFPPARPGELANWEATNNTSPDYFSTNAPPYASSYPPYEGLGTNPSTAVGGPFTPYNYDPSPSAHNGCLGLVTITDFPDNTGSGGTNPYVEYATQQLPTPLRSGRTYYASMQVYSGSYAQYAAPIGLDITTDARDFRYNPFKLYAFSGHGIQSPGVVSAQQWTRVSGTFPGVDGAQWINVGNFQPATRQLVRPTARLKLGYVYVDNIEVYEVPQAGNSISVICGASVTIGEGCAIPGASYAWTVAGSNTPFATSLQTTVRPTTTTTYTLVVTLPDGKTSTSSITVSAGPPSMGALYGEPQVCYDRTGDGRDRTTLSINSPAPAGYSYYSQLVENATGRVVDDNLDGFTQADGTFRYFLIGGNYTVGNYTLRVRLQGTCPTPWQTKPIFIVSCTTQGGPCSGRGCDGARATTAYPNPAAESLSLPEGTQEAILINNQGNVVQTAGQTSMLDVRKLPEGLYNLRMKQGSKVVNQRVQIKH